MIEYGQLALDPRGKIAFEMAEHCIARELNLSPLEIKDTKDLQWGKHEYFRFMPGLIQEALMRWFSQCFFPPGWFVAKR